MSKKIDFSAKNSKKQRQKLRFYFSALLLICTAFALVACVGQRNSKPEYLSSPFEARVETHGFLRDFSAKLTVSPPNGDGRRGFTMTLTAPESLKGAVISSADESSLDVRMGNSECIIPKAEGTPPSRILSMIFPDEPILSIKSGSGSESGLPEYESLTVITTASYVIYLDSDTDLPVKASDDGGRYIILSYDD